MSFIHLEIELEIEPHLFENATSVVAYAVMKQTSSTTKGFISSKSRLSQKTTSIPRLELVRAMMVKILLKIYKIH